MHRMLDDQLETLKDEMITMGAMCEDAIAGAAKSFTENDAALGQKVTETAEKIDRKEREIESICLKMLLMQQPVAADLRKISAALKMVTDLERIGNQSADIAEIAAMGTVPEDVRSDTIHDMALASVKMVNESIEAFLHDDADEANSVIAYDDVVDGYFDDIKHKLVEHIKTVPQAGEYAIDLLMIAKYFERIADHAVNVAKWVIFSISGELVECN